METSNTIIELAKALSKFQGEIKNVKKDATNPFFKSRYASLENVWDTIREKLLENGLSVSQFPNGENELTTILLHISGEWMRATAKMTPKDITPQGQGSAITYMRRYALSAILGLATEEDDDGAASSGTRASTGKIEHKTTPVHTLEQQKKDIFKILTAIFKIPPRDKEDAENKVFQLTQLSLEEVNYQEIKNRLHAVYNEK